MINEQEKIKEVKQILGNKPQKLTKRVSIIFDGKQYNLRIPIDFVQKAELNPDKEEFEFTLEIPEDKSELPKLYGELVEKE